MENETIFRIIVPVLFIAFVAHRGYYTRKLGIMWIGMTALEVMSRIRIEETMMISHFGDQYRVYIQGTGRLLPRLFHLKGDGR